MSNNNYSKNRRHATPASPWVMLPLILTMIIVPTIIHYASVDNDLEGYAWHGTNSTTVDMFLYYKCWIFTAFSALLFMILLYKIFSTKKVLKTISLIPLGIYAACVILSTIFSSHLHFSLVGIENHFEPVWVLLGYCICCYYAAYFITDAKRLNWLLYGWLIGTAGLTLIGVFQAFKLDIFLSDFIGYFTLPKDMWGQSFKLKFPLGKVYITLYNPNYIGFFATLTVPIFTTMAIFAKERWQKICWGVTTVGLLICLFGAESKNGMVGLAFALLIMIIGFRRRILKYWPVVAGFAAVLVVAFFTINTIKNNYLITSIKYAITTSNLRSASLLEAIDTSKDGVTFKYDGEAMRVEMDTVKNSNSAQFTLTDVKTNEGIKYSVKSDGYTIVPADDRFPFEISYVTYEKLPCFKVLTPKTSNSTQTYEWVFTNQLPSSGYFYLNALGKWTDSKGSETAIFTNYPTLASGRGYIWARSIPLLKKYPIIGSGPDTFVFDFPQNDYASAIPNRYAGMVISKPHNLFLQVGAQTGTLSMVAIIVFFLILLVVTFKQHWKHPLNTIYSQLSIAICAATFGYLISGLANDSTNTYSFVFWILMGTGIAVNRLSKQADEEQKHFEASAANKQETAPTPNKKGKKKK